MDLDIYKSSYMVDYKPFGKHKYSSVTPQEVGRVAGLLSNLWFPGMIFINFFCMCFPWCVCVCATSTQCPKKSEESVGSSGTRMLDGCESPSQCWWLNPGPQQVQQMLLTTEPFLQIHDFYFSVVCGHNFFFFTFLFCFPYWGLSVYEVLALLVLAL